MRSVHQAVHSTNIIEVQTVLGTGDSNTVSALKLLTVKLRSRLVNRQIHLDVVSADLGWRRVR